LGSFRNSTQAGAKTGSAASVNIGSISKQGDRYLRSLFVAGALAIIRYVQIHGTKHRPWLTALLARRPAKIATMALARVSLFSGQLVALDATGEATR
jgi:transposase